MDNFNLTHNHVSIIFDTLKTQTDILEKSLKEYDTYFLDDTSLTLGQRIRKDNERIEGKQCLENRLKLRNEILDVLTSILNTRDPVDIHISR